MPTDKLNLPLITENMIANVPRDMNALAEAVDDAAGTDLATLEADGMIPSSQMRPIPGLNTHMSDLIKHVSYVVATGSANAYAVTLSPAPSGYSDGLAVSVKINADSTGAATLNVNGLGARPLKQANGEDVTDLKRNGIYTFRYDSANTRFVLQGGGAPYARNVKVEDANNRFNGDNVEAVLNELFTFANDGKTNIANVIGYPATTGDTFSQLRTHIQNSKNTLATNLTSKGVPSQGTEALAALAAKISQTQLVQWVSGTSRASGRRLTVSGLPFKPSVLIVGSFGIYGSVYAVKGGVVANAFAGSDGDFARSGEGTITDSSISVLVSTSSTDPVCNWIVFE